MDQIIYRLARVDDVAQLVTLRVLMQEEVNPTSEVDAGYLATVAEYFNRALADGSYFSAVAEIDGKLVAATGLVFYDKPPSLTNRRGSTGYVSNVYTLPESRGQGIATRLMDLNGINAVAQGAT